MAGAELPSFSDADWLERHEITELQVERLGEAFGRARKSEHYREIFAALGIQRGAPVGLELLGELPLLSRDDVQAQPGRFVCAPAREVVRVHYTAGRAGAPLSVPFTAGDLMNWAECLARWMMAVGVGAEDVLVNCAPYHLRSAGLGLHYAAELVGCTVIPAGAMSAGGVLELIQGHGATVLHATPLQALRLARAWKRAGVQTRQIGLSRVLVSGQPLHPAVRQAISELLACPVYDCYGLAEMWGPGVAMECQAQAGLHVFEDHFIVEVIDPVRGETLPPGQWGELVLTPLTREAVALLRYRTGDLAALAPDKCKCGREHARLEAVRGRVDELLILEDGLLMPVDIDGALAPFEDLSCRWTASVHGEGESERVRVEVEVARRDMGAAELARLAEAVRAALEAAIAAAVEVSLVGPGSLAGAEGVRQIADLRE